MILDRARTEPFALAFTLSALTVAVHTVVLGVLTAVGFSRIDRDDSAPAETFAFALAASLIVAFAVVGLVRAYRYRSCPTPLRWIALFTLLAPVPMVFFYGITFPLALLFLGFALNVSVYVAPHDDDTDDDDERRARVS